MELDPRKALGRRKQKKMGKKKSENDAPEIASRVTRWCSSKYSAEQLDRGSISPVVPFFSVVTFNILAQTYARQETFTYASKQVLDQVNRRASLTKEICRLAGDILCFQEMDYYDHWATALKHLGYFGLYHKRPGKKKDGCAIFWNYERFSLVKSHQFDYNRFRSPLVSMNRDNVGQLVELKMHSPPLHVCVANTHLYWDPNMEQVKFAQAQLLIAEIAQFVGNRKLPVIVCGDFNSMPDSRVYSYLVRRGLQLRMKAPDATDIGRTPSDPLALASRLMSELSIARSQAVPENQSSDTQSTSLATQRYRHIIHLDNAGDLSILGEALKDLLKDNLLSFDPESVPKTAQIVVDTYTPLANEDNRKLLNKAGCQIGWIAPYSPDAAPQTSEPAPETVTQFDPLTLPMHSLDLSSSYAGYSGAAAAWPAEPQFTNYTQRFKATLDYILFTETSLDLLSILELPPPQDVNLTEALPNALYASDHVSLKAEFAFK